MPNVGFEPRTSQLQDLKKYFDSLNGEIDADVVKSLMYQLLRGLNYCHTHNVLHRLAIKVERICCSVIISHSPGI